MKSGQGRSGDTRKIVNRGGDGSGSQKNFEIGAGTPEKFEIGAGRVGDAKFLPNRGGGWAGTLQFSKCRSLVSGVCNAQSGNRIAVLWRINV